MELVFTVLVAFPIGWFIRNRMAGFLVYVAAHGFVFVFQSTGLVLEWVDGNQGAFGPYPHANKFDVWSYGVVNLIIFAGGLGLVWLGQVLSRRRRARNEVSTPTASVPA